MALIISLSGSLKAQTFTGSVTCVVTDPAGAVIPGAQVTITNTATGETREVKSNSEGRFTFAQLQPSTYTRTDRLAWRGRGQRISDQPQRLRRAIWPDGGRRHQSHDQKRLAGVPWNGLLFRYFRLFRHLFF
jgi:hypothetical protein